MLVAEHFDTGPVAVDDQSGATSASIEGADVNLGTVEIENLEVDQLTVNEADVSGALPSPRKPRSA
jgi:hypothetical protein